MWLLTVQLSDALVDPVVPLPWLSMLHAVHDNSSVCNEVDFCRSGFSFVVEFTPVCNEVINVASEISVDSGSKLHKDNAVVLVNGIE